MEAPGQFDVAAIGICYIGGCQRYFLYHFGSKTWCFPKEILSCQGSGMPCICSREPLSLEDLQRARSCADDVRRRAQEWEREAWDMQI